MPATEPKSLTCYALACVIGAIVLVVGINNAYWLAEPFPGGMSARGRLPEFGWIQAGIDDLVLFWSIPADKSVRAGSNDLRATVFQPVSTPDRLMR